MAGDIKVSKRSMAELRKLRKRESILVDALCEIKATNEGKSDQPIESIIEGCIAELAEVEEKEKFLTALELPKIDPSADAILKKIRERRNPNYTVGAAATSKPSSTAFERLKKMFGADDDSTD